MFCEPLDKEQLRLSIENFERIDNIILYRQENTNREFVVNGEDAHPISKYEHIKTIVDNLGLMPGLVAAIATAWSKANNVGKECALLPGAA